MKYIIKYKNRGIVIALLLFLSFNASTAERRDLSGLREDASSLRESKISDRFSERSQRISGNSSGGIDLGTDSPDANDALSPVGDALPWLLSLGLGYGIYVFGKKKRILSTR
jgi:hypothetical protein